ncbi:unnamed protein product [Urochloa humidicola]
MPAALLVQGDDSTLPHVMQSSPLSSHAPSRFLTSPTRLQSCVELQVSARASLGEEATQKTFCRSCFLICTAIIASYKHKTRSRQMDFD